MDMSIAADDALVAASRRGDADAFGELYHRHKADVLNLATFMLRDRGEAEDATQETFLKAYRGLHHKRHGEPLRPWLLTICRRTCLDRVRARPARPALSLDDLGPIEPATPAVDLDMRIDIHSALGQLAHDDREAFFLVDVLGCHSDEAARIVGVRASSTLRSRVATARRALAPVLRAPESEPRPEVWGVFHAAAGSAVVACAAPEDVARRGAAELLARLRTAGLTQLAPGGRDGPDLVAFFELLDARIPRGCQVVAVLDPDAAREAAAIAGWAAAHPRWRLRSSSSQASWLDEVGYLLGGARPQLRRLQADEPFLWTMTG